MMFTRLLISIAVYSLMHSNIIDAEDIDISTYDIIFRSCDAYFNGFEESVTCSFAKTSGTSASVSFFSDGGNCAVVNSGGLSLSVGDSVGYKSISATFSPTVAKDLKNHENAFVQQSFCLKAETFHLDSTSVTFVKVKIDVFFNYDLEGTFTLNVNAAELATVNKAVGATKGTAVEANRCLNDGSRDDSSSALSQGSTLRICLSPEDSSKVAISSFDMTISPPDGSTSFTNQPITQNGEALNGALTNIEDLGSGVKLVKTVMISKFFSETTVKVDGTATVTYLERKNRALGNARALQATGDATPSPFSVDVELVPNEADIFMAFSAAPMHAWFNSVLLVSCSLLIIGSII